MAEQSCRAPAGSGQAGHEGLRAVYETRDSGSILVRSLNGTTLITDRAGILNRWAEHFQRVLNQESKFDQSVLDEIPQWDTADALIQLNQPRCNRQLTRCLQASRRERMDCHRSCSRRVVYTLSLIHI